MRGRFRESERAEAPPHRAEFGFSAVLGALSPRAGRGKPYCFVTNSARSLLRDVDQYPATPRHTTVDSSAMRDRFAAPRPWHVFDPIVRRIR